MKHTDVIERIAVIWALVGIIALLTTAMLRISEHSFLLFQTPLSVGELSALAASVLAMAYLEGYRGFQRQFTPRFISRTRSLLAQPKGRNMLFAPLYCMSLFGAPARRVLSSWLIVLGILLLVLAMDAVSQPWRGIISTGVLAGLTYGLISLILASMRAFLATKSNR